VDDDPDDDDLQISIAKFKTTLQQTLDNYDMGEYPVRYVHMSALNIYVHRYIVTHSIYIFHSIIFVCISTMLNTTSIFLLLSVI
jgi:hypothetical protein